MRFHSAETLEDALQCLAEGDEYQVLAGGTDVMIQHQRGEISPSALLHIERLESLAAVDASNGHLRLGALVTHRRAWRDRSIARALPALAEASATVGGWQTQEIGTIVGNVVNASPAADTVPALLNANCTVELESATGTRSVALADFLLGRRKTARNVDELVTALLVEPIGPGTGEIYLKVGPRSAMEVALVGLAVRLTIGDDDRVEDARVAVCSVRPVPYRVSEAESVLVGSSLDQKTIEEAGRALVESAEPIDDARATASYRSRVLAPLLERALGEAAKRAKVESPA